MLRRLAFVTFPCLLQALLVLACEGECITGITKALVGNYSVPFDIASQSIADTIFSRLVQNPKAGIPAIAYISPIIDEYHKRAEDNMRTTIFKTYFHGKCQDPVTNIDPDGCPNPDCPVVCGTPGSMVHFYSVFRYRAFNSTVNTWNDIIDSDSTPYKLVERAVLAAAPSSSTNNSGPNQKRNRQLLRFMRFAYSNTHPPDDQADITGRLSVDNSDDDVDIERREDPRAKELKTYLRQFRLQLTTNCGGTATGKTNSLPNCSWEQSFKNYILSFP
ncbi:hypothetical protein CPB84DRAFT_1835794 [Gymnopilus junonius]|uniref:Uncharacterized protein n=1 Tax=Gymnopilus junonius TaxID=109634 RepID=A0A9P5NRH4_GYMJU|nr:hypothetical protein CPB84DRAFT_1835794 [Gymnopilus junonius]